MSVDPKKINLSEKDLEDYLYQHPEKVTLPYTDWTVQSWFGRQLRVPSGIIDLIGITEQDTIVLVELKNTDFEAAHLTQIQRYSKDIEEAYSVAGGYHDLFITKMLIGIKPPKHNFLVEADSMGIFVKTMKIEFDVNMDGSWHFSDEYYQEYQNKLLELSKNEVISRLAKESEKLAKKELEIMAGTNG